MNSEFDSLSSAKSTSTVHASSQRESMHKKGSPSSEIIKPKEHSFKPRVAESQSSKKNTSPLNECSKSNLSSKSSKFESRSLLRKKTDSNENPKLSHSSSNRHLFDPTESLSSKHTNIEPIESMKSRVSHSQQSQSNLNSRSKDDCESRSMLSKETDSDESSNNIKSSKRHQHRQYDHLDDHLNISGENGIVSSSNDDSYRNDHKQVSTNIPHYDFQAVVNTVKICIDEHMKGFIQSLETKMIECMKSSKEELKEELEVITSELKESAAKISACLELGVQSEGETFKPKLNLDSEVDLENFNLQLQDDLYMKKTVSIII